MGVSGPHRCMKTRFLFCKIPGTWEDQRAPDSHRLRTDSSRLLRFDVSIRSAHREVLGTLGFKCGQFLHDEGVGIR